jgi:hypothetical protein
MSNLQTTIYEENYYEYLEERADMLEKQARRHLNKDVKPFNLIMGADELIFNSITK